MAKSDGLEISELITDKYYAVYDQAYCAIFTESDEKKFPIEDI